MDLTEFLTTLPLGKVHRIKKYSSGQHNQTFLVTSSKGKFSLRIFNYKKPAQIRFEIAILLLLKGLDAPQLVELNNGFIEKFGKKYVIAYRYLPGKHLLSFNSPQLNEVGEFIADFHNRCKGFTWKKWRYQFYYLPDWKINKFERISKKAGLKHLELLQSIISELKENRLPRSLPRGPIHVDIKPENTLFQNGKLSGVIDFDNSFVGPLVLDLAKSMVWFGTSKKKFILNDALQVYYGYIKNKPLSKEEFSVLYKAIKFAFLSHIFVDYYMRAIKATSEEYFEWIINDLYESYLSFELSEQEFYETLKNGSLYD